MKALNSFSNLDRNNRILFCNEGEWYSGRVTKPAQYNGEFSEGVSIKVTDKRLSENPTRNFPTDERLYEVTKNVLTDPIRISDLANLLSPYKLTVESREEITQIQRCYNTIIENYVDD